ncbi:MAG: tetratricopeptide repeat protein [Armatimonadota bacterium]
MSRFDHIEMSNPAPVPKEDENNEPDIIDQDDCMSKADAFFDDEDYERALGMYSRALQYDVNLENAWLGQLRCLMELGEFQEAEIWSKRALDRFADSAQLMAARGVNEGRMGDYTSAIRCVDAAFGSSDITPYAWIARGEVLTPVNAVNAKACFLKAVEMAKNDWRTYAWIGRSYMVHGCCHQALDFLKTAVRLDNNRYACWYRIGKCYEALRQPADARTAYRRALSICPSFLLANGALIELDNQGFASRFYDGIMGIFGRHKNDKE